MRFMLLAVALSLLGCTTMAAVAPGAMTAVMCRALRNERARTRRKRSRQQRPRPFERINQPVELPVKDQ